MFIEPNLSYIMTQDKSIWGNHGSKFDINHWMSIDNNNNYKFTNNFASMPFSIGKRNCVGQLLAMKRERIVLANLILRYKFANCDNNNNNENNIQFKSGITRCFDTNVAMPIIVSKR